MKSNFKIFNVMGIDVELHISFILFVLLFLLLDWSFLIILFVLFASITLHELSHSIIGKLHGINVKKIVLLPIGGMAAMDEVQLKPYSEFKMSIAGPLLNFSLCTLIALAAQLFGLPFLMGWADWNAAMGGSIAVPLATMLFSSAFWLNWLLGSFNLFVPAIPLDGGRVFRSALALVTDYVNATRIATTVSTVITFFLFLYALFTYNIILLVISIFVYLGAVSELEYALSNKLLAHFPLQRIVRANYLVLKPATKLDKAIEEMIKSRSLVAFTTIGRHMELVSLYDIRHVPKSKWKTTSLKAIANRVRAAEIGDSVTVVMHSMMRNGLEAMPVISEEEIVGVVFRDDIDRVFEILKVSNP
ncbi:site-2 protease family protein [archaeon]